MDLDALRSAALSSKKRKLAAAQAATERTEPPTPQSPFEPEEGEIADEPVPRRPAEARACATIATVKEECKQIISELLSYGIPPDYMLSIGVSRHILRTAFYELHLDSSLIPPNPNLSARSSPFEPFQLSTVSHASQEHTGSVQRHEGQAYEEASIDYDALELEKRKKLFAKKAALKARNQRQAQSLESELECLFAAAPAPDETAHGTGEVDHEPGAKRPRLSRVPQNRTADEVHSLRETIDHVDETVQLPLSGPFAYNPSFARPNPSSHRRPVAADLDHLPSHRLSESALSRQRVVGGFGGPLFNGRPGVEESLVIEISDDEDEEDGAEDTVMSNEEQGSFIGPGFQEESRGGSPWNDQRVPSPTVPRDPTLSILPTPSTTAESKAAQVGELLRQRQLEEKELQIKRIMDRIKDLESRKTRSSSAQSEVETEVANASPSVRQEVANPEVDKLTESNVDEITDTSAETSSQCPGRSRSVDPVYRPYASTLSRYPLLGGRPSSSLSIPFRPTLAAASDPTTSPTSRADLASDVGSAGLSTFVAQKHQLDPARKWCKAESLGGVCRDGTCKSVHERDWVAKEEDRAEYLLQRQASKS